MTISKHVFATYIHFANIALATLLCACVENPGIDKNEEYTREFVKEFGVFDTSHDWNIATKCKATVDVSAIHNAATVRVCTERPGTPGAMTAAEYPATQSSFYFDFDKNAQFAFVQILDVGGDVLHDGYYPIDNRCLNIGRRAIRRTPADGVCPTTIGDPIRPNNVVTADIRLFPDDVKEIWRNLLGEERYRTATLQDGDPEYEIVKATEIFSTYILDNKQTEPGKQWSLDYISTIVGSKGKFLEQICNVSKFRELLHPERGVEYTLEKDGPVAISYFWGGTIHFNKLGYFYYNEGASLEEIMHAPRFILIYDARPQNNIMFGNSPTEPGNTAPNGGMDLPVRLDFYEQYLAGDKDKEWTTYNRYLTGTRHNLVYFGDAKEFEKGHPGSYTFPAGTHVAFFVVKNIGEDSESKDVQWRRSYSLPELNRVMNYKTNHSSSCRYDENTNIPAGMHGEYPNEDFVTYRWNGYTVMGIEDGTDHDANDMMFYVYADIEDDDIPVAEEEKKPDAQSWILAMEDLGNTDDFDFNDLVVQVSHTAGENKISVKPLAAGGTLPTRLYFRDMTHNVGYDNGWLHINEFFGEYDHTMMINTTEHTHNAPSVELEVEDGFTMSSDPLQIEGNRMGGFHVRVQQDPDHSASWTQGVVDIEPAMPGSVPQMICVPGSWEWPRERTNISDAYPMIREWIKDRNTNTDWYMHPVKGRTVRRMK